MSDSIGATPEGNPLDGYIADIQRGKLRFGDAGLDALWKEISGGNASELRDRAQFEQAICLWAGLFIESIEEGASDQTPRFQRDNLARLAGLAEETAKALHSLDGGWQMLLSMRAGGVTTTANSLDNIALVAAQLAKTVKVVKGPLHDLRRSSDLKHEMLAHLVLIWRWARRAQPLGAAFERFAIAAMTVGTGSEMAAKSGFSDHLKSVRSAVNHRPDEHRLHYLGWIEGRGE